MGHRRIQGKLYFAKNGSDLPSTSQGATWQQVMKSLDGKTIRIQTPVGSGLQLIFAEALREAGVTNVTYVNLGGGNDVTLAALNNGSVDVAQVNPTGTQRVQADNSAKTFNTYAQLGIIKPQTAAEYDKLVQIPHS
jgi:NitT/TauT family transport system substrate-binding protein